MRCSTLLIAAIIHYTLYRARGIGSSTFSLHCSLLSLYIIHYALLQTGGNAFKVKIFIVMRSHCRMHYTVKYICKSHLAITFQIESESKRYCCAYFISLQHIWGGFSFLNSEVSYFLNGLGPEVTRLLFMTTLLLP